MEPADRIHELEEQLHARGLELSTLKGQVAHLLETVKRLEERQWKTNEDVSYLKGTMDGVCEHLRSLRKLTDKFLLKLGHGRRLKDNRPDPASPPAGDTSGS